MARKVYKFQEFNAHTSNVRCVKIGRKSGSVLATGGDDRKVNLWATGKPNNLASLAGHKSSVQCLSFDASEEQLAAGSAGGSLIVWDLASQRVVRQLNGHKTECTALDFHPYSNFFASGSADTNLKIWDLRKKTSIQTYKGHMKGINQLRFSPDGRWIATAGDDAVIKIWDLTSGRLIRDLTLHTGPVCSMDFHPNEFLLATGSHDRTVKFWDLETFDLISSTPECETGIKGIGFSPDGKVMVSASSESLRLWAWEPVYQYDSTEVQFQRIADLGFSSDHVIAFVKNASWVTGWTIDLKELRPFVNADFRAPATLRPMTSRIGQLGPAQIPVLLDTEGQDTSLDNIQSGEGRGRPRSRDPDQDASSSGNPNGNPSGNPIGNPSGNPNGNPNGNPSGNANGNPSGNANGNPNGNPSGNPNGNPKPRSTRSNSSSPNFPKHPSSSTTTPSQPPPLKRPPTSSGSQPPTSRSSSVTTKSSEPPSEIHRIPDPPKYSERPKSSDTTRPSSVLQRAGSMPAHAHPSSSPAISSRLRSAEQPLRPDHPPQSSPQNPVVAVASSSRPAAFAVPAPREPQSNKERDKEPSKDRELSDSGQHVSVGTGMGTSILNNHPVKFPNLNPAVSIGVNTTSGSSSDRPTSREPMQLPGKPPPTSQPLVPSTPDQPVGLDFNAFLPKPSPATADLPDEAMLAEMTQQHSMITEILSARLSNVKILRRYWSGGEPRRCIEGMIKMNDLAVLVDVLSAISHTSSQFDLDMCTALLPKLAELLDSQFEGYILRGLLTAQVLVDSFGGVIRDTRLARPVGGVDLKFEERLQKCNLCADALDRIHKKLDGLARRHSGSRVAVAAKQLTESLDGLRL